MESVARIVNHFLKSNEPRQVGNYVTNGKVLIFVVPEHKTREVLAVKFNDLIIGNSSGLRYAHLISEKTGRRRSRSTGETFAQAELAKNIAMIPFDVFTTAKLDLSKFSLIERAKEETLTRFWFEKVYDEKTDSYNDVKKEEKRHFTGASVFKVDKEVFLFDFDRNELKHGILNPFLVKLSVKNVKSVQEAYESLKPEEVLRAEKLGLDVERQGEWFFIPANEITSKKLDKLKKEVKSITLRAGPNRPNYGEGLQMYQGKPVGDQSRMRDREEIEQAREVSKASEFFMSGTIKHSGREHKDLVLKGWFKAVPNTAVASFTILGDVD